jgi:hypothetical protein
VRAVDGLDQLTDDLRAGRIGQLRKLLEMLAGRPPGAEALARGADEYRPLDRRIDGNQVLADGSLLVVIPSEARDPLVCSESRSLVASLLG